LASPHTICNGLVGSIADDCLLAFTIANIAKSKILISGVYEWNGMEWNVMFVKHYIVIDMVCDFASGPVFCVVADRTIFY